MKILAASSYSALDWGNRLQRTRLCYRIGLLGYGSCGSRCARRNLSVGLVARACFPPISIAAEALADFSQDWRRLLLHTSSIVICLFDVFSSAALVV